RLLENILEELGDQCNVNKPRRSIRAVCPAGIGDQIAACEPDEHFVIEAQLAPQEIADYGYHGCFKQAKCRFRYQ
ncbi:MAG TPA: hypothetical protein GX717_06975, partial [Clostridiaceae bacterium]|nr:hypothetical protein [Clostridiaceae bacterium]